jgi:outer membrane murein-binding lipoprotein Lpp
MPFSIKGYLKGGNNMKSREEHIDQLAAQLKEWSGKIDELESKASAAKADVKISYENQIRQLKEKRDVAAKKLQELKGASADAWDILKAGAETSWKELKNAVTAAAEKFK